jgi:integrase
LVRLSRLQSQRGFNNEKVHPSARGHLEHHIEPLIGATKLAALTVPFVRAFEDRLRQDRSPILVTKVLTALAGILDDAMERGLVAQNVARRRKGGRNEHQNRHRRQLAVGADIPTPAEIRAIVGSLEGRWRPVLLTAIFTGLRASELRGLPWSNVDLTDNALHVRQRADAYGRIGSPKSAAGSRTVPLPPLVANTLREWKLQSQADLVFADRRGQAMAMSTLVRMGWQQAQLAAGITAGKDEPKYPGFHALRLLCLVVHQPESRRRARTAAQDRAGSPGSYLDQDDCRHLRTSIPTQRRRSRTGGSRARVHGRLTLLISTALAGGDSNRRRDWRRPASARTRSLGNQTARRWRHR